MSTRRECWLYMLGTTTHGREDILDSWTPVEQLLSAFHGVSFFVVVNSLMLMHGAGLDFLHV